MSDKAELGDIISLQKQEVEVVACKECGALMVNIDADQIEQGDLLTLKRAGVKLSNPETSDPICLKCQKPTFKDKLNDWFDDDDDDDDSSFFHSSPSISTPIFGGSSFGGGFGGFGGGIFSGGGAGRSF